MLFNTEKRDIEIRNIYNMMEAEFMSVGQLKFNCANTLDGACSGAIAKSNMTMRARIWLHRDE